MFMYSLFNDRKWKENKHEIGKDQVWVSPHPTFKDLNVVCDPQRPAHRQETKSGRPLPGPEWIPALGDEVLLSLSVTAQIPSVPHVRRPLWKQADRRIRNWKGKTEGKGECHREKAAWTCLRIFQVTRNISQKPKKELLSDCSFNPPFRASLKAGVTEKHLIWGGGSAAASWSH